MGNVSRRTVLFADLRGSTGLYESLGNTVAAEHVTRAVHEVAHAVERHRGVVVKTLGDGLLAVFARPGGALNAALEAQQRLGVVAPGAPQLHLQLGLGVGDVVEVDGDCFGDAVNVAARLLDHADTGETLVTRDFWRELSEPLQLQFRSLPPMQLRGRQEPVEVLVHCASPSDSLLTHQGTRTGETALPALGIMLSWRGKTLCRARGQLPLQIGRNPDCGVVIDDGRVSRSHARIDAAGAGLELLDLSINGTFVRFGDDDEVLSLRRGSCTLHGHGAIGLGAPPSDGRTPTITFATITQPHELDHL
ncbi:adenylate/guanylate cyclase domain-containing protein [Ideonella livida]|uniref:Adenylate/guanylate cyclase domain-containing protein n=1 Tax=Ideonella livida TaxID=2707176 RepID=A0A7C9THE7_9BURK|nr:adenylate/guanylate cyclase domain-containing protein [Ideonella livida]NDY90559.1 adenylate/guanylate cyclase domain-containing protein [Ideonella livida]